MVGYANSDSKSVRNLFTRLTAKLNLVDTKPGKIALNDRVFPEGRPDTNPNKRSHSSDKNDGDGKRKKTN